MMALRGWGLLNGRNLLRGEALGGHVRGTGAAGLDSTVRQCDTGSAGEHWGALGSTGEHWGALGSTGEHWRELAYHTESGN